MCTKKGIEQTELAEIDSKKIVLKGNQTRTKTKEAIIARRGERMGSYTLHFFAKKINT
jgi:hypothetical protein